MTVADRIAAAFGYVRRPLIVRYVEETHGAPPPAPTREEIVNAIGRALDDGFPVAMTSRTSGPRNRDLHIDLTFRHKGTAA